LNFHRQVFVENRPLVSDAKTWNATRHWFCREQKCPFEDKLILPAIVKESNHADQHYGI
jgi:hypothetical protein